MVGEYLDEVLERLSQIFAIDVQSELEEEKEFLEGEVLSLLDEKASDDFEELKTTVLKMVLEKAAKVGKIVTALEYGFAHYSEQEESGLRDFCYIDSDSPFSDEDMELMYECQGIWQTLPPILVKNNLDLARKAATKYHDPSRIHQELEFEDLIGIAQEALMLAAKKHFKKPRGDFRKFAMSSIQDKIKNHQSSRHPVPYKTRKKLERLREVRETTGLKSHDEKTTKELSKKAGFSEQELEGLYEVESIWGSGHFVDFGDRMEDLEVPDLSPDALSLLIDAETSMRMSQVMTELTTMQRNVILQIYFKDQSFRQVAKNLDLSLSVVKKHHKNAMQRLKKDMD